MSAPDPVQRLIDAFVEGERAGEPLRALLERLVDGLGHHVPTDNLYVALYDEDFGLYSFPISRDEDDPDTAPRRLPDSLTDYVRRSGTPLLCTSELHRDLIARGLVAYVGGYAPIWLGVPLVEPAGAFGAVVVQSYTNPARFGPAELAVYERVAAGISDAIARIRRR